MKETEWSNKYYWIWLSESFIKKQKDYLDKHWTFNFIPNKRID